MQYIATQTAMMISRIKRVWMMTQQECQKKTKSLQLQGMMISW
jgi:hypothetical protein